MQVSLGGIALLRRPLSWKGLGQISSLTDQAVFSLVRKQTSGVFSQSGVLGGAAWLAAYPEHLCSPDLEMLCSSFS